MERSGLLDAVITQNIDMLHRKAGTRELVEVHGSIASCLSELPRRASPLEEVRARVAARRPTACPAARDCGAAAEARRRAVRRAAPRGALARARELCEGADVLLCIGSSLEVHPVAGLPLLTRDAGGAVAIITQGPTPLDELAGVRLSGDVVAELRALVRALGVGCG